MFHFSIILIYDLPEVVSRDTHFILISFLKIGGLYGYVVHVFRAGRPSSRPAIHLSS